MEIGEREVYRDLVNRGIHPSDANFVSFREKLHKDQQKGLTYDDYKHVYYRLKPYLKKAAKLVENALSAPKKLNMLNELRDLKERKRSGIALTPEQRERERELERELRLR